MLSQVKHSCTFHSALREELGKKYTHQDKGSHEHYLGLDVGDGVLFWKNDGASCLLR